LLPPADPQIDQEEKVTESPMTQEDKVRHSAADSGAYFRYMTEFVGFTPSDAEVIRQSGLIIEKYLPSIVADFYTHLLRYPPTRAHFLKPDGSVDQDYLQVRMQHLTNFWRRTASGSFDDDYARYVDYVGRAHTARGADPGIYIAERYVIGQVGFMQHAISKAIEKELAGIDEAFAQRAMRAWNLLMMVILEMLARVYGDEHAGEAAGTTFSVDHEAMQQLAVDVYERGLGLVRETPLKEMFVARVEEIPDGERKIVQVDGISIGVFHHKGEWYALRNYCLHRGGPVATGCLEDDVLTCPWHGFKYNVTTGQMLVDPNAKLEMYRVNVHDGQVYITVAERQPPAEQPAAVQLTASQPAPAAPAPAAAADPGSTAAPAAERKLQRSEFYLQDLPPGKTRLVVVDGTVVAVYNVAGQLFATQNECTHAGGPLNEGTLEGYTIECPWHGSCFNVRSGQVQRGPARQALRTYSVNVEDGVVQVTASS
jgi:nitrite reductase/ring-hydroxylating ferredoxin subunit